MEFTEIRNEIQRFSRSSLVRQTLHTLQNLQQQQHIRYPFWKLLVLLKWTFIHTDDNWRRGEITVADFHALLEQIEKFEIEYGRLSFKTHQTVQQSFRIIAYQQFDYQEEFYNAIIDRQIVLYSQLRSRLDIEAEFLKKTRIDLSSFLSYCYFTYIYINKNRFDPRFKYDGILGEDFENYFCRQFSKDQLKQFLGLLSIKNDKEFEKLQRLSDERLQLYETNFFITKPFLRFKGDYRVPHRAIFNQTIKHFVYTYLKAELPDSFPEEFGKRMEKYIGLGLKEALLEYQTENELKKQFSMSSRIADYRVSDNILLECKATELHPRSGVLRLPNIITSDLNTSIIKAYTQLLSTAHAIDSTKQWWGIIITYREMYLGFGPDAWNEFLQTPITEYCTNQEIDLSILPPENLIFIPIDDWDYMVQAVKDGKGTVEQILQKAQELNANPNLVLRKFLMNQVLSEYFPIKNFDLSYLTQAHASIDILSRAEGFN